MPCREPTQPLPVTRLLAACLATAFAASAPLPAQVIFADGLEDSDLCAWSRRSLPFSESFAQADGSGWAAGVWSEAGNEVALADVVGGQGRLRPDPSGYALARMVAPVDTLDVEVRFTLVMEDVGTQGVGFYVRSNGGYLQQTMPHGQGYAVFAEGFRGTPRIGVWRERDGIEEELAFRSTVALGFADAVPFRVRFRVNQVTAASTLLQAKIWPAANAEPLAWDVTHLDELPELQGNVGHLAVDSYSSLAAGITAHTRVDDIEVEPLCNPLAGRGPLQTLASTFTFAEGPVWRGDHLLFTDIGTAGNPSSSVIWRHTPAGSFAVERSPANHANGLATDVSGGLLACEQGARRVSLTDTGGTVSTLAGDFGGLAFNAPNDLAVRRDGTLYFTDPTYGMPTHGQPRQIAFNGLYRRAVNGTVSAEWQGAVGVNEPNGVALSPDEQVLYVTDTQAGALRAWDVTADGALANPRLVRTSITIPDGICVDRRGNIFVGTWAQALEVYAPDGARFGAIALGNNGTNCAFGGTDGRTLYITALDRLHAVDLVRPGIP